MRKKDTKAAEKNDYARTSNESAGLCSLKVDHTNMSLFIRSRSFRVTLDAIYDNDASPTANIVRLTYCKKLRSTTTAFKGQH